VTQALHQILIVDDEPGIRGVLRTLLVAENYRPIEAETASRGLIEARSHKPDLLIVDLGLPDNDGLQLIREVRRWSPVPILVLSARAMEEQKIAALDAGADDYVTKPFSAAELLARVRATLRRKFRGAERIPRLKFGEIEIDLERRESQGPNGEIHFTPLEYRVIECLARGDGRIVTQRQLIEQAWGPDRLGDTRGLRVCIKNLRSKLEADPRRPRFLVTETGVGYRLTSSEAMPFSRAAAH
jgi:two-component system KDP operon response regulator KdpE